MVPRGKSGALISAAESMRSLLGPPPLIDGEDPKAYKGLYDHVVQAITPDGPLEEIWVRDIVDLLWETLRLRRLKMDLMASAAHEGLDKLLQPLIDNWLDRKVLVQGWAARDRESVREVNALLKQAGFDERAIRAQTLAAKLDTFERIDRLIMQTEARRNAALREIDRHRDALAQQLREVSKQIEDAEFMALPPRKEAAE